MSERRNINLSDRPLSLKEIYVRTQSTVQVVMGVCQYTAWNQYIDFAVLFGSLARLEGDTGSDADVAFVSRSSTVTDIDNYLKISKELRHSVDKYKESLKKVCNFSINPLFALQAWMDRPQEYSYVIPAVLEKIKKEGIVIYSK